MAILNVLHKLEESLIAVEEKTWFKVSANKAKQYNKTLMKTCPKGMKYSKAEQRCLLMSDREKQSHKLVARKSARTRRILLRNTSYKNRVLRKTKKTMKYRKMLVGGKR